jgi:uncharacterized protein YceK
MKKLLLSIATVASLSGCATVPDDTPMAVTETEYATGSNIPRKKYAAKQESMTVEQAEEMRRAVEAQRTVRQ